MSSVELRGEQDMYINYTTEAVVRTINIEVVESFVLDIKIPFWEVRYIVERNFTGCGNCEFCGFMKINAIKELRDTHFGISYLGIGLREAKEMIEAVYNQGIEAGNYHTTPKTLKPYEAESNNHMATADTLPF